jgi:ATP-dependent Clp protease ATP-binding subunit ClpA
MFDEVEKASQQVTQTLLSIFDNGIMTMASGQTIDFRNAIIIMTGNLGARELYKFAENQLYYFLRKFIHSFRNLRLSDRNSFVQDIVKEKLEKKFSPEFINRIDDIIIFDWLKKDVIGQVLELHVQQLNQRLEKHNASLVIEDSAIDFLVSEGFNRQFGVRALKRTLHKYLEVPLAEVLLKHPYEDGVTYVAKYTENMCIESVSSRNIPEE